jgi:hypothetical protein
MPSSRTKRAWRNSKSVVGEDVGVFVGEDIGINGKADTMQLVLYPPLNKPAANKNQEERRGEMTFILYSFLVGFVCVKSQKWRGRGKMQMRLH